MPSTVSPYRVTVRDLMHRAGDMREQSLAFDVPEQLGAAVATVPAGTPIRIDLRLEGLHEGILVSGHVSTTVVAECVRCLERIELDTEVEFQEVFAYSPDDAFDYTVHDNHVDCEPVVRDAVVLSLPFQPVCQPDCPGLDPETGERLVDHPERKPREVVDPRWAALQGFATETDNTN
jgi:uncharacterized protein